MPSLLNVGGMAHDIPIPPIYDGWENIVLDIDPKYNPDIVMDARELGTLKRKFDSAYLSHVLEHFYPWDVPKVLKGIKHVLTPNGFAYIRVPDLMEVIRLVYVNKMELDQELYQSAIGPIRPMDVIYGHQGEIEKSGHDWMAHKIGYSPALMRKYLEPHFKFVYIHRADLELIVIAADNLKDNPFEPK